MKLFLKLFLGVVELKSNEKFTQIEEKFINNKIDHEITIKIQSQIGWTEEWYSSMKETTPKNLKEEKFNPESINEGKEFVPGIKLIKKLGSGAFGDVWFGILNDSKYVAVKMLQVSY